MQTFGEISPDTTFGNVASNSKIKLYYSINTKKTDNSFSSKMETMWGLSFRNYKVSWLLIYN